jgi:pimeloyl-ACP methyl ester carboxylesterase
MPPKGETYSVEVFVDGVSLRGDLGMPREARGLVLFAHGSGSSRLSPRNNAVASQLRGGGLATLLFDLMTEEEDRSYARRFDIDLLTRRLVGATRWVQHQPNLAELPIGYFGASTGSAAALRAAAEVGDAVRAVVSRGGRPDLALDVLSRVTVPTLLIVGGADAGVIDLNRQAFDQLTGVKHLSIIPGATHLFEEVGTLDEVARLARDWFRQYLQSGAQTMEDAA